MPRIPLADIGDLTKFGRDRGTGTVLPNTDLRRGDTYFHTALGLMVWTGTLWRQAVTLQVATETDAAALITNHAAAMQEGFRVYCTGTKAQGVYDGVRFLWYDTAWQTYTPAIATSAVANLWSQNNGVALGRYFRKGREVSVECQLYVGTTTQYGAGAAGAIYVRPPAGYYPANFANSNYSLPLASSVFLANGGAAFGWVVAAGTAVPADRWFTFYQTGPTALTGAAGSAGSWNMWQATHNLLFSCTYETAFQA